MPSGMSLREYGKNLNGKMINARLRSMRPSKVRREKGKARSPKASLKGRLHRNRLLQGRHSLHRRRMSDPKPEARSCMTNDFLFAMMNTKSKPTWRHSIWDDADYIEGQAQRSVALLYPPNIKVVTQIHQVSGQGTCKQPTRIKASSLMMHQCAGLSCLLVANSLTKLHVHGIEFVCYKLTHDACARLSLIVTNPTEQPPWPDRLETYLSCCAGVLATLGSLHEEEHQVSGQGTYKLAKEIASTRSVDKGPVKG